MRVGLTGDHDGEQRGGGGLEALYVFELDLVDGNPYQYRRPGRNNRDYDLFSYGADGREGGEEEDADVTSW